MKIRLLQTIFLLTSILILAAYSTGPAANGIDRTGSPFSGGQTCSQCHNGAGSGTTIIVARLLSGANPVTSYTPGQVYTLELQVSNSNYSRFGGQVAVLNSSNGNTGTWSVSPLTSNTKISTLSGRKYLEHNGFSTTGLFQTSWTAPVAGTGTVKIYAMGLAVNGTGNSSGDKPSAPTVVQITETPFATINYAQNTYCGNVADPTANIVGTTGGSFSSTTGLVINSSTGQIDLSASTPNTYTVTYTYGNGITTTFDVTITAGDDATIAYDNSTYCTFETNPTAMITGTTGGQFSATPSGLAINSGDGTIDLATSSSNTYTISYTTNGTCPTTTNTTVTVSVCAGISSIAMNAIQVYPNPTLNGLFTIKNASESATTLVEIYTPIGQLVSNEEFYFEANTTKEVNLPTALPRGIYMVKIQQKGASKTIGLLYQ